MSKKINWAGVLLVLACVAGIWYVSTTFEQEISITGTVTCISEPTGTLWIQGEDGIWYMPVAPISPAYTNGTRVTVTAIVKKGDIATHRENYLSIDILTITRA